MIKTIYFQLLIFSILNAKSDHYDSFLEANNYMENFEDDYDILFEFAQSKINNVDLNDHKTFMKFINNFKSRGFDTNIISKVLKKIKNHEK